MDTPYPPPLLGGCDGPLDSVFELEIDDQASGLEAITLPMSQLDQSIASRLLARSRSGTATYPPVLTSTGTGGTYLLSDARGMEIAVFKPADEEANAPFNPRGLIGEMGQPGLRQGIRSGEASTREVLAYMLDQETHFSGVPLTLMVNMAHSDLNYADTEMYWKQGAFQEYIRHDDVSGDVSEQNFPVSEVHKIGILDIRLLNTDRNDGNILVRQDKKHGIQLIPVDHGYCLPDILEIAWCDWIWIDWPQSRLPFNAATLAYIAKLSFENDSAEINISGLKVRKPCLTNMRISTMLLKKGAAAGLTLHQIAKIISRDNIDAPSLLEIIVAHARALARKHVRPRKGSSTPPSIADSGSSIPRSSSFSDFENATAGPMSAKEVLTPLNGSKHFDFTATGLSPTLGSRRSSFGSLSPSHSDEVQEKLFEFLEVLMDDLVMRKASTVKHGQLADSCKSLLDIEDGNPRSSKLARLSSPPMSPLFSGAQSLNDLATSLGRDYPVTRSTAPTF